MKSRYAIIAAGLVVILLGMSFASGLVFGANLTPDAPSVLDSISLLLENTPAAGEPGETSSSSQEAGTPQELDASFEPFWKAWSVVHEQFVSQPVDDSALVQGAIQGMLESLDDPYTAYMDPVAYDHFNNQFEGEYSGIGVLVDVTADYLTVISSFPGSPAEAAGLRPGDQIVGVDGEDMTGLDGNLVISRILGPTGTAVSLLILREGGETPFEVELTRQNIEVPSVTSRMLEDGIGYIHLIKFGRDTTDELRNAIQTLLDDGARGLVLDVRDNGGGLLVTSVEVSSEFISDGVILYQEFADGTLEVHEAIKGGMATTIPMVMLVNGGSASASEILAGAIQDSGRATLVGTTTFGKGSVQNTIPLSEEGDAVRLTTARWLTPQKRQISEVGIQPDVVVELTEEDIEAGHDVQLEKALEILKSEMGV
ncbi:MAG TPA: S41 family peptidase [Anaerolineales bacterium]|nr:S41 family peptidase [Anaerolineales bacterium]